MPEFDPSALVKLDSMIAAADYSSDHVKLGDLLLRRSDVRLKQGRQPEALTDIQRATEAFIALEDWRSAGRAHLLRARLLAGQAGEFEASNSAYNDAAAFVRMAGDTALYSEVLEHKAASARAAGALDIAGGDFLELEEAYAMAEDWKALAQVKLSRASLHHLHGLPHKALTRLDEAVELAQRSSDPETLLHIRLARRAYTGQTRRESSVESLHELLEEAQGLGLSGPTSLAHLNRAAELARSGKHAQAAAQAELGRQASLEADDPLLYLFSCLLLAECREALGDKPGVLAILLTCKGTLENRLGKAAGQPVVILLDSLESRWGAQALEEALRNYRREARERLQDPTGN